MRMKERKKNKGCREERERLQFFLGPTAAGLKDRRNNTAVSRALQGHGQSNIPPVAGVVIAGSEVRDSEPGVVCDSVS